MDNNFDLVKFPDWYFDAYNFEWFMCDREGYLANLSSGASLVPSSIQNANPNKYFNLQKYFMECAIISPSLTNLLSKVALDRFTNRLIKSKPDDDANAYFEGYNIFAEKGLYCYDRKGSEGYTSKYELIVKPHTPLHISSLSSEMADLVSQTMWKGLFSEDLVIDVLKME